MSALGPSVASNHPDTATDGGAPASPAGAAAVELRGARMVLGQRVLWDGLDLRVAPGELVAVLGPNGSGKTTLLKVLLGQRALSAGTAWVGGRAAGRGPRLGSRAPDDRCWSVSRAPSGAQVGGGVGYLPQGQTLDRDVPLRARDLVGLGLDGHRLGMRLGRRSRRERSERIDAALAAVGATGYADAPVGRLSGGEQQRLRVAQALIGDPSLLLCDEPLLSLDLANQWVVSELINRRRAEAGTAVLFVTHEINPILPLVDRVLYLVDGRFEIGPPERVMTSEVLSRLYRTQVDVLRVRDRLLVVGTGGADGSTGHGGHDRV